MQAPAVQSLLLTWAAEAVLQTLPQPPQLFSSVALSIGQPFCGFEQEIRVPVHLGTQVPAAQLVLLAPAVEHAVVHVPQWFVSVLMLISQPLLETLSQLE